MTDYRANVIKQYPSKIPRYVLFMVKIQEYITAVLFYN